MNIKILTIIGAMVYPLIPMADQTYSGTGLSFTEEYAKEKAINAARSNLVIKLGAPIYLQSNTTVKEVETGNQGLHDFTHTINSYLSMSNIAFTDEKIINESSKKIGNKYQYTITATVPDSTIDKIREKIDSLKPTILFGEGVAKDESKVKSENTACLNALTEASNKRGKVKMFSIGDNQAFLQSSSFNLIDKKVHSNHNGSVYVSSCVVTINLQ